MKFFQTATDGGAESHVTGFFFVEIKSLFSIVLLHFRSGSREAYHSHAFNAVTWFIRGHVREIRIDHSNPYCTRTREFKPSFRPKFTPRENCHRVVSIGDSYALSFRGPWRDTWQEFKQGKFITLTHGRKVVE